MPRNYKSKSSNEQQSAINKKSKDKPTYKIIVLGCGGVGKVSSLKTPAVCFFDVVTRLFICMDESFE